MKRLQNWKLQLGLKGWGKGYYSLLNIGSATFKNKIHKCLISSHCIRLTVTLILNIFHL